MVRLLVLLALLPVAACRPPAADTAPDPLQIVPRSAWNATPARPDALTPNGPIRFVTIHHTFTPDTLDEAAHVHSIQRMHQGSDRHWGDIAYHYLVGPSGTIFEGRDERYAPSSGTVYVSPERWTAAGQDDLGQTLASIPMDADGQEIPRPGASAGHLTVSVLGDYTEVLPSEAAREALVRLVAARLHEHGLTADDVYFHREVAVDTECPGQRLYDWFRGPERRYQSRGPGLDRIAAELDRLRSAD